MSGRIVKYIIDKRVTCSDCEREWDGPFCEAEGRKHALETGHIVTLHATYDIAPRAKDPTND